MIWIVRALLAVSALFSVVFEPRVFFGSGTGGGWISFASWFHDGSWWAFRLALAALVLSLIVAATSGAGMRSSWRELAVAVVLVGWALVRGVPHPANQSTWSSGDVGALAWLRAQRYARDEEAIAIGPEAFAGRWAAADGTTWTFAPNEATRIVPDSAARSEAAQRAKCGEGFRVVYLERGRDVFVERGLDSSAHASTVLGALPRRARVAVASVACSDQPWSAEFVRVGDELWLFEPFMTNAKMRGDAFVLHRAAP